MGLWASLFCNELLIFLNAIFLLRRTKFDIFKVKIVLLVISMFLTILPFNFFNNLSIPNFSLRVDFIYWLSILFGIFFYRLEPETSNVKP